MNIRSIIHMIDLVENQNFLLLFKIESFLDRLRRQQLQQLISTSED